MKKGSRWPATSASTCREPLGESAADCPVGLRAGSEARFPTDCRAWPSTDGCTIAFRAGYAAGSVEAGCIGGCRAGCSARCINDMALLGPGGSAEEFRRRAGLWSRSRKSCALVSGYWSISFPDFLNLVGAPCMFLERGRGPIGKIEPGRRK